MMTDDENVWLLFWPHFYYNENKDKVFICHFDGKKKYKE